MSFSLLDKPVQYLKGVGPVRAAAFGRMGIYSARDLLFNTPRRYDDASTVRPIATLEVGQDATAMGRVRSKGVIPTRTGLRIFQAVLQDDSGMITCAWPGQPWVDKRIEQGDLVLVSGPVKFFHGRQVHPREMTVLARDHTAQGAGEEPAADKTGTIFTSYSASEELPQWVLRRIYAQNLDGLLERVPEEEYLSAKEMEELGVPTLAAALGSLHLPTSLVEVEQGRRRLAYDELFFLQLVHAMARRKRIQENPGTRFERSNEMIRPMLETLPFELTGAQKQVLKDIMSDMTSGSRMNRLLQGDVGSGKTVVALFAMLLAVEGGYQSALMAPTEILAEQHASRFRAATEFLGVHVELVTGRVTGGERRERLARLASGKAQIVVGTHALIQEGVEFQQLGLVVIDEQHRFGVRQRMELADRADVADVLVMSATPIPRSLAMALYGDLDLSVLDELPAGRTPVKTWSRYSNRRDEAYKKVLEHVERGRQAYVVFPLVDESEKVDLRSAIGELPYLEEQIFKGHPVALLHGKMSGEEKYQTMRAFADGSIRVLVTTSVVEVGIDVANATAMVIEHADRFGLSQLHQLRGRVGRGTHTGFCVLIADPGPDAKERLDVLKKTTDGFRIAEEDLRIRGQGDFFGDRQHGRDVLRFADLSLDQRLLERAQRRARAVVESDPGLSHPRHERLRRLLETRHAERLRMFGVA